MNVLAVARDYLARGWLVTPVGARQKRPVRDDWPRLKIPAERVSEYFADNSNIGVVLGDVSGGLVDIDLDCPEAIALADAFLPATAEFGRASARRSHRLYCAPLASTERFAQPLGRGKSKMIVELRANKTAGDGEGLQTVFPGSVHESGEPIEWEHDLRPVARVLPETLRTAVARLAAAAVLVRLGWTKEQAIAWGRAPAADAIAALPAAVQERIVRWLGLTARAPQQAAPSARAPVDNRLKRAAAYLARVPGAVSGSGGHGQTWTAALAVARGFDLTETDAYDLLSREYNPRCDPPWSERDLRHKIGDALKSNRVERGYLLREDRPRNGSYAGTNGAHTPTSSVVGAASATSTPVEWEPPVEFGVFDLPPFPTDALPSVLGDFVRALAVATQTPPDLAGMLTLAACAAAVAKRCVVEVKPGYREPLNLFVATILPPGERKSAVIKEVTRPLIEWEAETAEKKKPEIARAAQKWAMSKKRLDAITDRAAKAKSKMEREQLEQEAEEAAGQHAKLKSPQEPRILADDATPEALGSLLSVHDGRIAVFSAEGGIFAMMVGRYSDSPSLDVYLKAHAGDEIRVDRKGRPSERVTDPALTLGLAVQPAVLEALAEKPMLRGTGLLARFLYALPTSMLGARTTDASPLPDSIRAAYASALRRLLLLQDVPKPIVLKLSAEAYMAWCEFSAWIEPQLGEFGELASIRDWAAKLAGAVARIAGIIAISRILSTDPLNSHFEDHIISIYIDRGEMVRSITLGRYLLQHAGAAISSMGCSPDVQAAKHILRWSRERALSSFTRREVQQSTRRATAFDEPARLDRALGVLIERGFIRRVSEPANGPGRPSIRFEINPQAAMRIPGNGTRYPRNSTFAHIRDREPGGPIPGRDRIPGEDDDA